MDLLPAPRVPAPPAPLPWRAVAAVALPLLFLIPIWVGVFGVSQPEATGLLLETPPVQVESAWLGGLAVNLEVVVHEDFNVSADEELTVREIAAIVWEACGNDPGQLELEHLPSFEVDVQRRWPSTEKAKRLLGWQARIPIRDGIADTVRRFRSLEAEPAAPRAPRGT